jgi:tetratricopeptide (TPR) repeat protein
MNSEMQEESMHDEVGGSERLSVLQELAVCVEYGPRLGSGTIFCRHGGLGMQATTIKMADALLARGRELREQDRFDEAARVLTRLLGLRSLSPEVAERAQFLLGDIQLAQGQYSKARRHLAAAIATGTDSGETHFLMACAIDWDDESDAPRALYHYRRAVELDPGQPLYSSAYALMRIRRRARSRPDPDSLQQLREAFAASPDDQDVVHNYASGLAATRRFAEAELALRRARKRWPDHPAFEGLWFDLLRARGELPPCAGAAGSRPALRVVSDDSPVILKFPAPAEPAATTPAARSLSTRVKLKTALETMNDKAIAALADRLDITRNANAAQLRADVARTLLKPRRLESIFQSLSVGSRHLIQVIAKSGGRVSVKELLLRFDSASPVRGPHFARPRRAAQPLDELQQLGLVFLTCDTAEQDAPNIVMIPSDLRQRLRQVMVAAQ